MGRYFFLLTMLHASISNAQQAPLLKLPFPAGEIWQLTRGYNTVTHRDYGQWADDRFAVDFAEGGCNSWRKPTLAVAAGWIEIRPYSDSYGNTLFIDHGDGYKSRYAHLDSFSRADGEWVEQGHEVGRVGNTGNAQGRDCAEHPGTHLHYALYLNGVGIPPEPISWYSNLQSGRGYLSDNILNCHLGSPGDLPYCTAACPCASGEGDCDNGTECQPGLACIVNVGANYGYSEMVDVCAPPPPPPSPPPADRACHGNRRNGDMTYCSRACTCTAGEGDCDNSRECDAGLVCRFNVGRRYGFSRTTDVCERP